MYSALIFNIIKYYERTEKMKMRTIARIITMLLVVGLLITTCACGTSPAPSSSAPSASAGDPADSSEPAESEYTEIYELRFSIMDAAGGIWDQCLAQPLIEKLDEYSNGRIKVTGYYSGTISAQGTTFDAVKNGLADLGVDVMSAYSGTYPYIDLLETAGIDYGDSESYTRIMPEYVAEFPLDIDDDFVLIGMYSSGLMGLLTKKPVNAVADIKGKTIRCTGGFSTYIDTLGAASTVMSMSEVYESLKLGVIDGCTCTFSRIGYNNFWEQAKYFIPMTWANAGQQIVMSREVYNSMDPEAQAAVDKLAAEFIQIGIDYVKYADGVIGDQIMGDCPDFVITELSDEDKADFIAAAEGSLMDKVAEMNAAGLRGTEAVEWLKANAMKYYTED